MKSPDIPGCGSYTQRWEIETSFDELKTHQRGPRAVLRSKSPKLITQEIWGHLCCHYAIGALMFEAAAEAGRDPDRISFVAALAHCTTTSGLSAKMLSMLGAKSVPAMLCQVPLAAG